MAQRRSRKANFHSFESRSENSPYARITRDMINSPAWKTLNVYEQILYIYFKLKYNGKPGSENNISFTYEEGMKLMSKRVFTRSVDQLIKLGFIDLLAHRPYSALCNLYGLSDRWHKYGTPDFIEKVRVKRKCSS